MISRLGARCMELDSVSLSVQCESQHPLAAPLLFCTRCSFQRSGECQKPCCHGDHYSYSAEYQPHKKFISLICLRPPYLQVCLPRRLHLLACVTSCLSHYLPVCISVCPPASAPLLSDLKETLFSFQARKHSSFCPPCWLHCLAFTHYNTI